MTSSDDAEPSERGVFTRSIGARGADDRGTTNRALENRHGHRVAGAKKKKKKSAGPQADERTIFIVDDSEWAAIPRSVSDAAIAELKRQYAFVGAVKKQKAMTISLLSPEKFPEKYSFSDAVVAVVSQDAQLHSQVERAFKLQRANAVFSFKQLGVEIEDPDSSFSATQFTPELRGLSVEFKIVIKLGQKSFALPFMAAFVALDSAIDVVIEMLDSKHDEKKVRKRSKSTKASYVASRQSLIDLQLLSVFDHRGDPSQWLTAQDTLGVAIGRIMAHEVRHLYVSGDNHAVDHAVDGLGAEAPDLLTDTNAEEFSKDDKGEILDAIRRFEKLQKGTEVIPTFPQLQRANGFPFAPGDS